MILKQCPTPGCPKLVERGYCEQHRPRGNERRAAWRALAMRWYKSDRWAEVKRAYRNKPCVVCGMSGPGVVDHVVPHKGDYELFWDEFNWQKMCIACHNAKSARELAEHTTGRGGGNRWERGATEPRASVQISAAKFDRGLSHGRPAAKTDCSASTRWDFCPVSPCEA